MGVSFRKTTEGTHVRGLFFSSFEISTCRTDVRHVFGPEACHCWACPLECALDNAPVDHVGEKGGRFEAVYPEARQGRTQVVLQEVFGDVGGAHWF